MVSEQAMLAEEAAQHNATTPLLKLPREVRIMILDEILAGHKIRVLLLAEADSMQARLLEKAAPHDGVAHSLLEVDGGISFKELDVHQCDGKSYSVKETSLTNATSSQHFLNYDRLDVNVLFVCREINDQAEQSLYGKNTFFFGDVETCRAFLRQIKLENASFVQSLNLSALHVYSDWTPILAMWSTLAHNLQCLTMEAPAIPETMWITTSHPRALQKQLRYHESKLRIAAGLPQHQFVLVLVEPTVTDEATVEVKDSLKHITAKWLAEDD